MSQPTATTGAKPEKDWLLAEFARMVMEEATRESVPTLNQVLSEFRNQIVQQSADAETARRQEVKLMAEVAASLKGFEKAIAPLTKASNAGNAEMRAILDGQTQIKAAIESAGKKAAERTVSDRTLTTALTKLQTGVSDLKTGLSDLHDQQVAQSQRSVRAESSSERVEVSVPTHHERPQEKDDRRRGVDTPLFGWRSLVPLAIFGLILILLNGIVTGFVVRSSSEERTHPIDIALLAREIDKYRSNDKPSPVTPPIKSQSRVDPESTSSPAQSDPPHALASSSFLPKPLLMKAVKINGCSSHTLESCMTEALMSTTNEANFQLTVECSHCQPATALFRAAITIAIIQALVLDEPKPVIDGKPGARTLAGLRNATCDGGERREQALQAAKLPDDGPELAGLAIELVSRCGSLVR